MKETYKKISCILAGLIFIFSMSQYQTLYVSGDELPYIETQTSYTEQMIMDPTFDKSSGESPWSSAEEGDMSDINTSLGGGMANYSVIGDERTFSLVEDHNWTGATDNWTTVQNPNFPAFPDTYILNESGCCVSHLWHEDANQSVAANWEKNINMPINMSDYIITSASISAEVNGSVHVPSVQGYSDGIESGNDLGINTSQYATGDYVRFYILISDLQKNNEYEIANNQSSNLGQDEPMIDHMNDTFMVPITEESLIFFLTSVLSDDYCNFTITIGMRIWCEDNYPQDSDLWDLLIIKSVNLTFTYQKKIDQFNSLSWNQITNSIRSSDYDVPGSNISIEIDEAKLNFKHSTDRNWSKYSTNSEFRCYINDTKIPETVKLSESNSTWQNASDSGFDVKSYVFIDKNISFSLQVYLADGFLLDLNSTISIDDVYLNISFTVTVRTNKIQTNLETVGGSISYSIPWNDNFTVELNYTNENGNGITNANFTVDWVDSYLPILDLGGGLYNLICNNTNTISGQSYTLEISVNDFGYIQNTLQLEVNVIDRSTRMDIFMEETNVTVSPVIELPITSQLNVTALYYDSSCSSQIQSANISLYGINESSYVYSEIGTAHQFMIDTEILGLGTHLVSLVAQKQNYEQISELLRITVIPIQTNLTTIGNIQSVTVTWNDNFTININYIEKETGNPVLSANFTADWFDSDSYNIQEIGGGNYSITCNSSKTSSGQTYTLEISINDELYTENSIQIDVNVVERETYINIFMEETNVTVSPVIELPITSQLNVTALYYDSSYSSQIQSANISLYGISDSSYIYSEIGTAHQFMIDTEKIGLGTHLITLVAEKQNYKQITELLRITVTRIQTNLTTAGNIQSITVIWKDAFTIDFNYTEKEGDVAIMNANFTVDWEDSYLPIQEIGGGTYRITCNNTNTLSDQTYIFKLIADDAWYIDNTLQIEVNVIERETDIDIFMNGTVSELATIELPITTLLNITVI
ncbi:MAG: hypothetical protein ACTSWY_04205, partial [Promethearchaeota archaeon]